MREWLEPFGDSPLGWPAAPLAEIAVIAVALYALIGFIRVTRGAGVLRGLTVLSLGGFLSFLLLADYLRLDNVSWLLENAAWLGLVGLIVIFQPEIRQGLVRFGESMHLGKGTGEDVVKEIVDAAVAISQRASVGALIVVERDIPIDAYIASGLPLDAQATSHLLRTIFTKNTPLHDGAVVVRQGRVASANCLLPLSENVEVCRGMGTRHRAAIGISEESDAVTVVVSEENAQISVTVNGRIHRDLDQERLRAILHAHLTAASDPVGPRGAPPVRGGAA